MCRLGGTEQERRQSHGSVPQAGKEANAENVGQRNSADHSVIDAHYQWDGRGDKRATVIYENLCKEFTYTGTAALSREYETHGKLRERGGHWELPK